jgi:hypothetical protein
MRQEQSGVLCQIVGKSDNLPTSYIIPLERPLGLRGAALT